MTVALEQPADPFARLFGHRRSGRTHPPELPADIECDRDFVQVAVALNDGDIHRLLQPARREQLVSYLAATYTSDTSGDLADSLLEVCAPKVHAAGLAKRRAVEHVEALDGRPRPDPNVAERIRSAITGDYCDLLGACIASGTGLQAILTENLYANIQEQAQAMTTRPWCELTGERDHSQLLDAAGWSDALRTALQFANTYQNIINGLHNSALGAITTQATR